MSHFEITAVLVMDWRSSDLNAACALVGRQNGKFRGNGFYMKKFFNPRKENITFAGDKFTTASPLSKALSLMSSEITDVTLKSATFTLSTRGVSAPIPTQPWSVWKEVRRKHYTVHFEDVSADDPKTKLLLRILREMLDDHAHRADPCRWNSIRFSIARERLLSEDGKLFRDEEHTYAEAGQ